MACILPSKEELLVSIDPNMGTLSKGFIKRVYGYGVTDASFPDKAITALEAAGCSKARQYYEDWIAEYKAAYRAEVKPVAAWYAAECEREWKKMQKGSESDGRTVGDWHRFKGFPPIQQTR